MPTYHNHSAEDFRTGNQVEPFLLHRGSGEMEEWLLQLCQFSEKIDCSGPHITDTGNSISFPS